MEQYEANSKSARPLIAKAIIGAEYKFLVAFPITEKLPPRQVQAVEGESTQSQQLALTASTAASAHEQSYLIVYNVFSNAGRTARAAGPVQRIVAKNWRVGGEATAPAAPPGHEAEDRAEGGPAEDCGTAVGCTTVVACCGSPNGGIFQGIFRGCH